MNVLIIDNYDSFTFNLYQFTGEILESRCDGFALDVKRNDEITLAEIENANYSHIILSPGPGEPSDPEYFGVCAQVILNYGQKKPVLGVCLGMQGIVHYFGGRIIRGRLPVHGKISQIEHDEKGVFISLPQKLEVMRYHSLVADTGQIPDCLQITAKVCYSDEDYEIMAVRHKTLPIEGIQFHPESFATEGGKRMLENFLFPPLDDGSEA